MIWIILWLMIGGLALLINMLLPDYTESDEDDDIEIPGWYLLAVVVMVTVAGPLSMIIVLWVNYTEWRNAKRIELK